MPIVSLRRLSSLDLTASGTYLASAPLRSIYSLFFLPSAPNCHPPSQRRLTGHPPPHQHQHLPHPPLAGPCLSCTFPCPAKPVAAAALRIYRQPLLNYSLSPRSLTQVTCSILSQPSTTSQPTLNLLCTLTTPLHSTSHILSIPCPRELPPTTLTPQFKGTHLSPT